MRRPATLQVLRSPRTTASSASAAPRRRLCTASTSPRRTWVSSSPITACAGEMRDVDLRALHQVGVGLAVDQREHAARAQALGQQAGHDVVLVVAGEREEQVHLADVLVAKQVLVGAVALEHQHVGRQLGRQVFAARAGWPRPASPGTGARSRAPGASPTRPPPAIITRLTGWSILPSAASARRICVVAASRNTSSPGSMRVLPSQARQRRVAAVDRDDAHLHVGHQARDLGQAVAHQRAAGERAHDDQADPPLGELHHLQRLGVLDQLADVGA